MVLLMRKFLYF